MEKRRLILVGAYPKSGSTWLARLLGDVLDSPVGAGLPSHDSKEIATEGQDRTGPYAIRKAHFCLVDKKGGTVIPAPHKLSWRNLTTEKVIFMVRDPRDIVVSHAHYWERTLTDATKRVISNWNSFVTDWLDADFDYTLTRYEDLLQDTPMALWALLVSADVDFDDAKVAPAVRRQSFDARKKWTQQHGDSLLYGKDFHLRFLRKGVAGDWKNHLTPTMITAIERACREGMRRLGYT